MDNYLLQLFLRCLNTEYHDLPTGASWAYDRQGGRLFLWFEHSRGILDWGNNLDFAVTPYRDMQPAWQCHAGFLRVWRQIRAVIAPLIAEKTVEAVCITGYSHGAAIALLCHEYVFYQRPDLRERLCGYGFGCPRVLHGCPPPEVRVRWDYFYRVTNEGDIVTRLPPRALGFCHVGQDLTIGAAGQDSPIDAHRPESYIRALKKTENA